MTIAWGDFEKVDVRVGVVTGPFLSEVLVLGAYDEAGEVILLHPDQPVAPGSRIG